MIWTLAIILLILWILGFAVFHIAGGLIHILLFLVVIVVVYKFITRPGLYQSLTTKSLWLVRLNRLPTAVHFAMPLNIRRINIANTFFAPIKAAIAVLGLSVAAAPAVAQSDAMQQRSYHNMAVAPSAQHHETARSLNTRNSNRYGRTAAQRRAQRRMDQRNYRSAMMAHHQAVNNRNRRYVRQQTAYANAMAAWRRQVSACHSGHRQACRARAPRTADFY